MSNDDFSVDVGPALEVAVALECQEQSKSHRIHQTIEAKLREDPHRREVGSFQVCMADVRSPEEGVRYWLRGNFWREEVAFPGTTTTNMAVLDRIVEIDLYFSGGYREGSGDLGQLTFDFSGFDNDGKIKEYTAGNRLMMDGTCGKYQHSVVRLSRLTDETILDWVYRRLLLDFDLDAELKKDSVRQITDDPNRRVGPLCDILRHLDVIDVQGKVTLQGYQPSSPALPSKIEDPGDVTLAFLRVLPSSCFNRAVAIMYDHFMASVYSLQRLGEDIYVRCHRTHDATKAYHYTDKEG